MKLNFFLKKRPIKRLKSNWTNLQTRDSIHETELPHRKQIQKNLEAKFSVIQN